MEGLVKIIIDQVLDETYDEIALEHLKRLN